ncbi:MAG: hypothetical protein K5986_03335 [Clostridium sp.]|nr:hypothetical protein [Clostridium sp.]
MFNCLYKQYKTEILKTSTLMSLKELKPYEKVFLTIVLLGSILTGIFSLLEIQAGIYISFGIVLVGIILLMVIRNRKPEQKRIVNDIIKPSANSRMQKMVDLLIEFGIDITEEKQLDQLITYAKREQDAYDVWKGLRKATKGMATYIILPIITIFLSDFFKGVEPEIFLERAFFLLFIGFFIILFVFSFGFSIKDMLNPDIRDLGYFISDIEDVKTFQKKAQSMTRKESLK